MRAIVLIGQRLVKRRTCIFSMLSLFLLLSCTNKESATEGQTETEEEPTAENKPLEDIPLADPFILFHDSVYYAYGTSSDEGFEVYYSDNLEEWQRHDKMLLKKEDSFGEKWFWAPEVYYRASNKTFYLFYSVDEHICVATSDSPLGPFKQQVKKTMLSEKAIDSSLFIDDDGTPYIYFVRFTNGNVIWMAELEDDWETIKEETLTMCLETAESGWEALLGKVNEGPSVVKKEGVYYMLYSANDYRSQDYGVGYAMSNAPSGPWEKQESNPILQNPPNGLVGTGHGAYFTDKKGNEKYVFHAHYNDQEVAPRLLHIVDIAINDGEVTVDENSIISPKAVR